MASEGKAQIFFKRPELYSIVFLFFVV